MTMTNLEIGAGSGVLLRQYPIFLCYKICCIGLLMMQQMLEKLVSEAGRKPMFRSGKMGGKTITYLLRL